MRLSACQLKFASDGREYRKTGVFFAALGGFTAPLYRNDISMPKLHSLFMLI